MKKQNWNITMIGYAICSVVAGLIALATLIKRDFRAGDTLIIYWSYISAFISILGAGTGIYLRFKNQLNVVRKLCFIINMLILIGSVSIIIYMNVEA